MAKAGAAADRARRERPKAPWDPVPLPELMILLGTIAVVAGVLLQGERGRLLIGFGMGIAALGSLENVIREHFSGYRPHSLLLASIIGLVALIALVWPLGAYLVPLIRLAVLTLVVGVSFWLLRASFRRRSAARRGR